MALERLSYEGDMRTSAVLVVAIFVLIAMGMDASATPPSGLAVAIERAPSTGKPSREKAAWLAETFGASCDEPWLAAAISWMTSGFRDKAVGVKGLGLMGLNPDYTPPKVALDPARAIPAGCSKMTYWSMWHEVNCHVAHDWLVHYSGGYKVVKRAIASAALVRDRLRRLHELGGV